MNVSRKIPALKYNTNGRPVYACRIYLNLLEFSQPPKELLYCSHSKHCYLNFSKLNTKHEIIWAKSWKKISGRSKIWCSFSKLFSLAYKSWQDLNVLSFQTKSDESLWCINKRKSLPNMLCKVIILFNYHHVVMYVDVLRYCFYSLTLVFVIHTQW